MLPIILHQQPTLMGLFFLAHTRTQFVKSESCSLESRVTRQTKYEKKNNNKLRIWLPRQCGFAVSHHPVKLKFLFFFIFFALYLFFSDILLFCCCCLMRWSMHSSPPIHNINFFFSGFSFSLVYQHSTIFKMIIFFLLPFPWLSFVRLFFSIPYLDARLWVSRSIIFQVFWKKKEGRITVLVGLFYWTLHNTTVRLVNSLYSAPDQ